MRIFKSILLIVIFACTGNMMTSCDPFWRTKERKRRFKEQIGTYILDTRSTDLGPYLKDSLIYKKLRITFKPDSTFVLNMDVPFMKDSFGIWEATEGDPDYNVNLMFFGNDKRLLDLKFHPSLIQFGLSEDEKGSVLLIINSYSKRSYKCINLIKFRKIN